MLPLILESHCHKTAPTHKTPGTTPSNSSHQYQRNKSLIKEARPDSQSAHHQNAYVKNTPVTGRTAQVLKEQSTPLLPAVCPLLILNQPHQERLPSLGVPCKNPVEYCITSH